MKCEQVSELLPDYLQGSLSPDQHRSVEAHLEQCADCSEEVAVWRKLSLLPVEQPSPMSRLRFEAMLQAYQAGRSNQPADVSASKKPASSWNFFHWLRSPLGAAVWSTALLAIGVFAGFRLAGPKAPSPDIAEIQKQLESTKQLVVLSMLQQQSASARLEGVSWSTREQQLNPQVLSALLHTLRYDPSVDVRLAALDALSRHSAQPQVRSSVVSALQEQQSPLVQVALIDQLVEWHDREAKPHLEKLRQSQDLNPAVRQHADWAISKLN
ncbi:MAG TPA: zf-HC2 domain-containing protein [Candidatus Acidoferrum sp.]|nr:zf-HC2 domain-containing protein [Candidatus Acidoferrum sp.]